MNQQSPHFHSSDEILAHPAFGEARRAWIDAILGLYENNPFLSRLLAATQRSAAFFNILVLDAAYDPADRQTWTTISLLQEVMAPYRLSSQRSIETIVARFVETGFLNRRAVATDNRVRLLVPTEKMYAHDLDWVRAYFCPLVVMFQAGGYELPMRRDPRFRRALRRITRPSLGDAPKLLEQNPTVTFMMNRDAGMMVLIKLMQTRSAAGPDSVDFTDMAKRFGISRTHVRRLLRDAEQEGLLRLSKAGIILEPLLVAAFDRFLADCMASFHALYCLAMNSPEMANGTAQ